MSRLACDFSFSQSHDAHNTTIVMRRRESFSFSRLGRQPVFGGAGQVMNAECEFAEKSGRGNAEKSRQGRLILAQRFIAGYSNALSLVPSGTTETPAMPDGPSLQSSLSGLIVCGLSFPPVNWWAIFDTSLRDARCLLNGRSTAKSTVRTNSVCPWLLFSSATRPKYYSNLLRV